MAGPAVRMAALSHEIVLRRLAPLDSSGITGRAAGRRHWSLLHERRSMTAPGC